MAPKEAPKPKEGSKDGPKDGPKDKPKDAPADGEGEVPEDIDAGALAQEKIEKVKATYAGCTGKYSKFVARNPLMSWCK